MVLHPSRFKTLLRLKRFDTPELIDEFTLLCTKVHSGLLYGVLRNQLLASIILADCCYILEQETKLMTTWHSVQIALLDKLQRELTLWTQSNVLQQNPLVDNIGDASYALDVLLRMKRVAKDDDVAQAVYGQMFEHIQSLGSMRLHRMDSFYCVIQLATHFRQQPKTLSAIDNFFRKVRASYQRGKLVNGKSTSYAPALMLRALLTSYGDDLRNMMMELLLKHKIDTVEAHQISKDLQRTRIFQAVIKDRTMINIKKDTLLTGGITKAEVFRVEYELDVQPLINDQETVRARLTPPSVVIKCGSRDEIQHAINRYQRLPPEIRNYFAQHSGEPKVLEVSASAPAYWVLEDLTEKYRTLHSIFDNIDQSYLSSEREAVLAQLCTATVGNLLAIYRFTRKPVEGYMGNQLYRLYLSRLEDYLAKICRPEAFPRLKNWYKCFWLGDKRFSAIEYYQQQINQHKAKFSLPFFVLAHGDCHSRNMMLDDALEHVKLIDLDKLEYNGDYILDFAKLLEDVALYRFLFDENHRRYLRNEKITLQTSTDHCSIKENRISYPPLTSDAVQQFQEHLLRQLEQFALEMGDPGWKERLWLGIAVCLLSVVATRPIKIARWQRRRNGFYLP